MDVEQDMRYIGRYIDRVSGDYVVSDGYPRREILDGMLWEVKAKWVIRKSHEEECNCEASDLNTYLDLMGCGEDFTVMDIEEDFGFVELKVPRPMILIETYLVRLVDILEGQKQKELLEGVPKAIKFLTTQVPNLHYFTIGSRKPSLIFGDYKDETTDPTFYYFAHGLLQGERHRLSIRRPHDLHIDWATIPLPETTSGSQAKTFYIDLLIGDTILSDSFKPKRVMGGMLWEVEGKWIDCMRKIRKLDSSGAVDDHGEGVDDEVGKVVDIVQEFSLQALPTHKTLKKFLDYMLKYKIRLGDILEREQETKKKEEFMKGIDKAVTYLSNKFKKDNLKCLTGKSFTAGNVPRSLIFAYYKDGTSNPTFVYFPHGLKSIK